MNPDGLGTATAPASADILLAKRKRGRPRKDDSITQSHDTSASSRVRRRHRNVDSSYSDDAVVGQIVTGVLDGSFDAGYLLTVRVGDTNMVLRGLVFEPGLAVPLCAANDVAPHVKMFQRSDIAIPATELKNSVPVYAHNLPSVSKSDTSVKRFQIISYEQKIAFADVKDSLSKPPARQSQKVNCSNKLFPKEAYPVAPLELEDDVKAALVRPQVLCAEAKENEPTLIEGQPKETGELSFSSSQFEENGGKHKTEVASDVNEFIQPKGTHIDENEAPVDMPQALEPAAETEDVNVMEMRSQDYTESLALETETKMGRPQSELEKENKAGALSEQGTQQGSVNESGKERMLSKDQGDDSDIREPECQSLHITPDGNPSVQFSLAKDNDVSTDAPVVAVQDSPFEVKRGQLNETTTCGEYILPKVQSIGDSNLSSQDAAPREVYPIAEIDQSAAMLKSEREVDIPIVTSDFKEPASATAAPKGSPNTILVEESAETHKSGQMVPTVVGPRQSVAVPEETSQIDIICDGQLLEGDVLHEIANANLSLVPLGSDNMNSSEQGSEDQVGLLVHDDTEIPDASKSDKFSSWEEAVVETCQPKGAAKVSD